MRRFPARRDAGLSQPGRGAMTISRAERDRRNAYFRKIAAEARLECLEEFGGERPRCACCGETELAFLTIEWAGRVKKRLNGSNFFLWLKRRGFPGQWRVLCYNCNLGRRSNGGVCPHLAMGRGGLEPPTSCVSSRRSIQLS
jgi:hypothetical protein